MEPDASNKSIYLFAKSNLIELFFDGAVEALTDAVRLPTTRLGARVVDVLKCQVELIFVIFEPPTIFGAAVSHNALNNNLLGVKPRHNAVVE